jgi:hypothetical protein
VLGKPRPLTQCFKQIQLPHPPESTLVTNTTLACHGDWGSVLQPSWAHT